tara:strand:- start:114 stop:515 length:402 start_codon:yes stop_codon:yes gene_type:complete
MNEIKQNIDIKIGSEKSFGYFFSVLFLIIAIYPLINDSEIRIWSIICSLAFFFTALLFPSLLILPNRLWAKFGILIGKIFSPLIMAVVYLLGVLPIAIFLKLFKKDVLNTKYHREANTYWIQKDKTEPMRNQF